MPPHGRRQTRLCNRSSGRQGSHDYFSSILILSVRGQDVHVLQINIQSLGRQVESTRAISSLLLLHANRPLAKEMESWLTKSGAVGLGDLELAEFPVTGRGVKTLRRFSQGERILTIPSDVLWSVERAYGDSLLGPALRSSLPPLSVEDILAIYILFVRSRESGYDGLRTHVSALPSSYSSSIFFSEEELEVCAGTSLYTITKQLEQRIEDDYRELADRVLAQHPDIFPLDMFTIEDVRVLRLAIDAVDPPFNFACAIFL